jgi:hypothetical protein
MKLNLKFLAVLSILFLVTMTGLYYASNQAEAATTTTTTTTTTTLTTVGLYSETAAGSVSYRIGTGEWKVIKVGDKIPNNAEITVTVDRDWIELIPSDNPNAVYEIIGSEKGAVTKKVADLLKEKPKTVAFPKVADKDKTDPKFVNKMVVKQYLGRQKYKKNDDGDWGEIKYGDVLDKEGTVNIIAINNTLTLVYPNGAETKVIGPIRFKVEKLFIKGQSLYKYLNVTK